MSAVDTSSHRAGRGFYLPLMVTAVMATLVLTRDASATRQRSGLVPANDEPSLVHHSHVEDGLGNVVARDDQYAADIFGTPFDSVDVVMQNCFAGGFVNDIETAFGAGFGFTVATASNWNQTALNTDNMPPGKRRVVDNFTRPWRADADLFRGAGMLAHFNTAVSGRLAGPLTPAIAKEPYSPPGQAFGPKIFTENPQYSSRAGANGAIDDAREIGDAGGGVNQFAVLVGWGSPNPRHGINIARVYSTLRNVYGIPANRIAVLYDQPAAAIPANPLGVGPDDLNGLAGVAVNGGNTRANWLNALGGGFFGVAPDADDKLFVYNTGHGDHAFDFRPVINAIVNPIINGFRIPIPIADGFETEIIGDPDFDSTFTNTPSYSDNITLSVLEGADAIFDAAQITINGSLFGSLAAYKLSEGSESSIDPYTLDALDQYVITVPHALLGTDPLTTTFDITGVSFSDYDLLRSFDFEGGDQGYLALVPEPGVSLLLFAGAPLLAAPRHARRRRA